MDLKELEEVIMDEIEIVQSIKESQGQDDNQAGIFATLHTLNWVLRKIKE